MYRTVFYSGLVVAAISALGLIVPRSLTSLTFLLPGGAYAFTALLLSLVLMHFSVAGHFRKSGYKAGFGLLGIGLVAAAIVGILDPTYFGLLQQFVRPVNLFLMLITGVGYLIAALEYDRPSVAEELQLMRDRYAWRAAASNGRSPAHDHKSLHNLPKAH